MNVQSILFPRNLFTIRSSINWLRKHKFKITKVDITDNFFRFRQFPPKKHYKYFTKRLRNGIELIIVINK